MPFVKRNIEPRHLCHGAVPEGIGSELECVTNNTLSAIIRQLSSLSKHAENVFGELFNEANTFYVRANTLQDRIDRLAVKVTQLDSSVEEVSLQDINMRKAFKSSTVQDQQVLSKSSAPNPVAEMYNTSDKPPPLSVLTAYREDCIDGMKFYTDPSYFFDLWKEKMLQDTEDKRKEKRRHREQKRCVDGTLQREVKKVRKARNRRQEWNVMAFDKEFRPDHRHPHILCQGASAEGCLSPDGRILDLLYILLSYVIFFFCLCLSSLVEYSTNPPPPVPGPPIPSAQTAFGFPLGALPPTPHNGPLHIGPGYSLPPIPPPGPRIVPPPPGPPPPPVPPAAPPHLAGHSEAKRADAPPVRDARSDLLSAIRMGIQLKKVQEQQEQQSKREPVGNDVATILSRRIAVEYSESDDESELEDNEWSD
uniref:Wiskott-Aldrich syndrome protein family member n=1 Tax=Myripristis murdjan TaxID=586833 RepID=A0A667XS13_9TELE